jgi:D-alanyl-D-alanine carboxypeptidase
MPRKEIAMRIRIAIILSVIALAGQAAAQPQPAPVKLNPAYSKAAAVRAVMEKYVQMGLPGVAIAVHTEKEGWWAEAVGCSRTEDKTPMRPEHMHYLQSVAKTFMATVILQLAEAGKLGLDDPISRHLPAWAAGYLKNPGDITVRMLLNHTSGIPEYNFRPEFVSRVILHPLETLSVRENLSYIRNEPSVFPPGSRYAYTNANFEFLSLIADVLTGDHVAYMNDHIFKPLGMTQTRYLRSPADLSGLPGSFGLSCLQAGGIEAWGHGGGGIGAGCVLLYIPAAKTGLFIATNVGVLLETPLTRKADPMKLEILAAILQ